MLIKKTLNLLDSLSGPCIRPHHKAWHSSGILWGNWVRENSRQWRASWEGMGAQVLILYCLQWLPGGILICSQRMWPYSTLYLSHNQQHKFKIKASTMLFVSQPWGEKFLWSNKIQDVNSWFITWFISSKKLYGVAIMYQFLCQALLLVLNEVLGKL